MADRLTAMRTVLAAFPQGLKETGYVEGQNVAIEYRWAEGHYDRLPALAADLVRRQVSVIAATGTPAAARGQGGDHDDSRSSSPPAATRSQLGLVASLNRPGGNVTGVTQLNVELAPKRLELLHELVPKATIIALLVNPTDPAAETQSRDAAGGGPHSRAAA